MAKWPTKGLGDLCNLATGGTPSRAKPEYFGGDIPWLVSGDINRGEIFECDGRITDAGMRSCNAKLLPRDSVMIALNGQGKTRATVAMLRMTAACNQSLVCLSPKDRSALLPEFLYANLHGRYEELRRLTSDDDKDRRGLNMGIIREIAVPVPPLAEQSRIVGILDEALEAIATAKANTEKNLQNAQRLRALGRDLAFLAISGRCQRRGLGDVCGFVRGPFGGSLKKEVFVPSGFAVYEQGHAIYDQFDEVRYFIDEAKFKAMQRFELRPGDLIMSCSGTIGKVAIAPTTLRPGIINQALLKLTPGRELRASYLKHWMESSDFQDQLRPLSGGAAIQNVASVSVLKGISLSLPTLNEQDEAVSLMARQAEAVEELYEVCKAKVAALDELKKSLLHQAFTGQLTAKTTGQQLEAVA